MALLVVLDPLPTAAVVEVTTTVLALHFSRQDHGSASAVITIIAMEMLPIVTIALPSEGARWRNGVCIM